MLATVRHVLLQRQKSLRQWDYLVGYNSWCPILVQFCYWDGLLLLSPPLAPLKRSCILSIVLYPACANPDSTDLHKLGENAFRFLLTHSIIVYLRTDIKKNLFEVKIFFEINKLAELSTAKGCCILKHLIYFLRFHHNGHLENPETILCLR